MLKINAPHFGRMNDWNINKNLWGNEIQFIEVIYIRFSKFEKIMFLSIYTM